MTYRDYINKMRNKWAGTKVVYKGNVYTVTDVDYNGALLIDKKAEYTETTAVAIHMIERA